MKRIKLVLMIALLGSFLASSCSSTKRAGKPKGYYSNGCKCPLKF